MASRMGSIWAHLRNELWKLAGKKRTYIGFLMFLLAQNLVVLVFRYTNAIRPLRRALEGNGFSSDHYITALTVATIMMAPLAGLLLPLYVALMGGDTVAKETEDGTLRLILARPVGRTRLLLMKWLAGVVFCAALVTVLGVFGIGFAWAHFPWGGLFVWMPEQSILGAFDGTLGLQVYALAHGMMVTEAVTIFTLALMFSCFQMKPAAATVLALSVVFLSVIFEHIPYFRDYRQWFFTYHLHVWQWMFAAPVPWWQVAESSCLLAGFNATFVTVGGLAFYLRDIKN